ncbi:LysR family transcriptional regulator [Xanthomonas vasicola]|nr:LysR family transcriptional regulator [Xanthomonas vasicola]
MKGWRSIGCYCEGDKRVVSGRATNLTHASMNLRPTLLPALGVFAAAARHQNFAHAAEELHLTASAVSHHVRKLEALLGATLFQRLPRGVKLTAEGRQLADAATAALAEIAAVAGNLHPREDAVPLRVTTLRSLSYCWLLAAAAAATLLPHLSAYPYGSAIGRGLFAFRRRRPGPGYPLRPGRVARIDLASSDGRRVISRRLAVVAGSGRIAHASADRAIAVANRRAGATGFAPLKCAAPPCRRCTPSTTAPTQRALPYMAWARCRRANTARNPTCNATNWCACPDPRSRRVMRTTSCTPATARSVRRRRYLSIGSSAKHWTNAPRCRHCRPSW